MTARAAISIIQLLRPNSPLSYASHSIVQQQQQPSYTISSFLVFRSSKQASHSPPLLQQLCCLCSYSQSRAATSPSLFQLATFNTKHPFRSFSISYSYDEDGGGGAPPPAPPPWTPFNVFKISAKFAGTCPPPCTAPALACPCCPQPG